MRQTLCARIPRELVGTKFKCLQDVGADPLARRRPGLTGGLRVAVLHQRDMLKRAATGTIRRRGRNGLDKSACTRMEFLVGSDYVLRYCLESPKNSPRSFI